MTDEPQESIGEPIPPPNPAKQKRLANLAKARAARALRKIQSVPKRWTEPPEASPYEGLSEMTCCNACKPSRCVITHDEICGTPVLGLQPRHAMIPAVVERRREARLYLEMRKLERRNAQR